MSPDDVERGEILFWVASAVVIGFYTHFIDELLLLLTTI